MRLFRLSVTWVLGVYIGSLAAIRLPFLVGAAGLVVGVGLLVRRRPGWLHGCLCLAAVVAGMSWYQVKVHSPSLEEAMGQTVVMEGKVVRGTEYSEGGAWLYFSAERVLQGECDRAVSGEVVVYTEPFPAYSQGDVLRICGEIRPLSRISNAGYRDFLGREGFVGTVDDSADIRLLRRSWLFSFRDRLAASLRTALAEPQASLAEGLLLGLRSRMSADLANDFARTGTSHLLAISGFNLAVIGGVVLAAAARVAGRRQPAYLAITLVIVWMYSALTGMQPPVLRAAIMFSLLLAGLWLGRPGSALSALALAAAVMAGLDPRVLRDPSFQLSFAAVAGLVVIQPPLQRWGERAIPDAGWAWSAVRVAYNGLAASLAAMVGALPLMVYHFQSVSLVGLPGTAVASLFVTPATMAAGATALLGLFWPAAAWAVGQAASVLLMCIVGVVEVLACLPFASVRTGAVPAGAVWACYLPLLGVAGWRRLKSAAVMALAAARSVPRRLGDVAWRLPRKRTAGLLSLAACLVWAGVAAVPGTRLQVSFLDVGQGDAVLIITPAGQQVLVDGGPNPDTICQRLGEELPFWDKSLDLVVLTHCHDDHLAGLMGVLQQYRVGQVAESGLGGGALYREWLDEVRDRGVPWTAARAGQEIDLGRGIVLEVIYPFDEPVEGTESEANSNSIVLRLAWNRVSFLLAGDADKEAEGKILCRGAAPQLHSDVLKIGHHGSNSSTSPAFLSAVQPQVVVICVGAGNLFGHPAASTLESLDAVDLYRTDLHGTVTFTTDGERLWLTAARPPAA